jgi:crotonobetainyl-CoA:carnitine CoA-transferase CaiB-like acyl-CoA transferase
MGSGHPDFCPYQAFPAKDGDVVIAALNDRLFGCVADAMGRPELATDPRFKSNPDRVANRAELLPIIEGFVAARTMDEVADVMQAKGAPATPVNTLDRVRDDKQVVALGGLRQIDQPGVGPVDVAHQALWFDGERAEADGPAPGLGEHGREILRDVGLKDDAIDAMLETGALVMNS